jgi:hypothetical protein
MQWSLAGAWRWSWREILLLLSARHACGRVVWTVQIEDDQMCDATVTLLLENDEVRYVFDFAFQRLLAVWEENERERERER